MIGLEDSPVLSENPVRPRWTFIRVLTDLAIIMVAVPLGLNLLAPQPDIPGMCGTTLDNGSLLFGLYLLFGIGGYKILKSLNDAFERACDFYWPMSSRQPRKPRKPEPLDDF